MYEGRAPVEEGKVLGHENMGIVEAVGPGVERVKVGDRVSVPFNIACGNGCELAGVGTGDTVAVFGAGPVGLLAAHSAVIRGASRVYLVDYQADRLRLGEQFGAEPIDFSKGDPVEQILDANGGMVDRGVEAVGFQAHDPSGEEHPELVLDNLVKVVRSAGGLGVIGVYVPQDEGAPNQSAKEGRVAFDFGTFFTKGIRMGTGQCPVKRYNRELRDLILAGRAQPGRIVSHELSLTEAPGAYEKFDRREDGWTKIVLHPAA